MMSTIRGKCLRCGGRFLDESDGMAAYCPNCLRRCVLCQKDISESDDGTLSYCVDCVSARLLRGELEAYVPYGKVPYEVHEKIGDMLNAANLETLTDIQQKVERLSYLFGFRRESTHEAALFVGFLFGLTGDVTLDELLALS